MEFFSKSQPNLIDADIKKKVFKIIQKKYISKYTISEKISHLMSYMYKHFVQENKGLVIFVVVIVLFLVYRYYNKSPKTEKYTNNNTVLADLTNAMTKHLVYNKQPSFDRLKSVDEQQTEHINYPPTPLPINLSGDKVVLAKDLYKVDKFPTLNTPKYDYDNVYTDPSRSYYTGTYNTYQNAQDTDIKNPLGFSNAFNTTTGNFITQMTDANKQNISDFQGVIDNRDNNLKAGLMNGAQYIKYNDPCLNIKPPYSEQY